MDNDKMLKVDSKSSLQDLLDAQISFQKMLGNSVPDKIVAFEHVQKALEHNTYQNIEFQEYMEADGYEKQEELIDYLLFMLNKYIYLGVTVCECTVHDALWGTKMTISQAACPCHASIEQYDFITLLRQHCVFKPWKANTAENCADFTYVYEAFEQALAQFRCLAHATFIEYYDMLFWLNKKLTVNIDRQHNGY